MKRLHSLLILICLWTGLQIPPPSGPFKDLFSEGEAIHLEVTVDLPGSEVSAEQARSYCVDRLAELGVPVAGDSVKPGEFPMPRLALSIRAKTVPVSSAARGRSSERHWYEVSHFIEFWDEVIYKRDPSIEKNMPLLSNRYTGTFFSREDYLKTAASRKGVHSGLDYLLERFERALQGTWRFDAPTPLRGSDAP